MRDFNQIWRKAISHLDHCAGRIGLPTWDLSVSKRLLCCAFPCPDLEPLNTTEHVFNHLPVNYGKRNRLGPALGTGRQWWLDRCGPFLSCFARNKDTSTSTFNKIWSPSLIASLSSSLSASWPYYVPGPWLSLMLKFTYASLTRTLRGG